MKLKNCLIIGSGRCGTSMVAGVLGMAPYYMGDRLSTQYDPTNRKGQFESVIINGINEELLKQVVPTRRRLLGLGKWIFRHTLAAPQRWLARLPLETRLNSTPEIVRRIQEEAAKEPFCFKDTRFPYTLDIWRPFLKNTIFICVFRDPCSTARSIRKVVKTQPYLRPLSISMQDALEVWRLKYTRILNIHRHEGEWLFIHYNQVLTPEGLDRIEAFTKAPIDRSFPDPELRTPFKDYSISKQMSDIYQELCALAGYHDSNA